VDKSVFTPYYGVLKQKVRSLRQAAKVTQRELARRLKWGQTMVARVEQGERRLDLVEFIWLCKALGVDAKKAVNDVVEECLALGRAARRKTRPTRR